MCDVGAVLVFNAKERPHASTGDFGESDKERTDAAMLKIVRVE